MRRFFTACILLGLVGPAYANETALKENEVPPPVIAAVKKKYPAASLVGFERETERGKTLYEVKLRDGAREIEAKLNAEGALLEVEEVIAEKDLPEPVRKSIAASPHAKSKIKKIERVTHLDKPDQPIFEIKIMEAGKTLELVYDSLGKPVAKG